MLLERRRTYQVYIKVILREVHEADVTIYCKGFHLYGAVLISTDVPSGCLLP